MYPGKHAQETPDKIALIMHPSGERLTYRELDERSIRLARVWREAGLGKGDHVALFSENHPRFFEVYWAAMRSGLYLTAVNRYLSAEEAGYIVDDCGAKAIVASHALRETASGILEYAPNCTHRLMFDGTADGYEAYEDAVSAASADPLDDQPRGQTMLYSSGTTGRPKGIKRPLEDRQINDTESPVNLLAAAFGMGEETTYLSPAPMYHSAPLAFSMSVQAFGGTVVCMEKFDPVEALRAIEQHKATHSQWVPTMFIRMLKLDERDRLAFDVSSLQLAIHAAAPCPVEVKRQMIEWWGPILVEYYAGTEANGMTIINSEEWLEHPGSVGRPVLGTIHICDELGNELPQGEAGLIYFEREEMPFEYHGDEKKTKASQHPEHPTWSTLGDVGYLDEEGYLYLTDRKAFMIISGGVNIYPQEIEDCLVLHDKVGDVAVFGLPDPDMGERVHAVVQPAEGVDAGEELEQELIAYAREKIANYKVPRSIDFTNELPRLPTGKLYKKALRDRYLAEAKS